MQITPIRTPELGDTSYLVVHDGRGILVDPQRDIERFLPSPDVELRWVLETHLHNDYVSGGLAAARRTGAELVLPAGAAPAYRHTPAFHREALVEGDLQVLPLHTPGHTPEHTSYVLLLDGVEIAVFSGGSLLVGAAGRSDLLGPERADTLARLQHRSIHRVATLPGSVGLYPTHGEGSFCATSGAGKHTSTIREELATNPALAYPDEDRFVEAHLGGLDPFPAYYRHMGPANILGAEAVEATTPPALTLEVVAAKHPDATVVDIRNRAAYAAGHLRGSLGIELGDSFATWAGWLIPHDAPIVLVSDGEPAAADAVARLARVGLDNVVGAVDARLLGDDTVVHRTVTAAEMVDALRSGAQVLDVRSPSENEADPVDGAAHRYLPDLANGGFPSEFEEARPVGVFCGGGLRAVIAAGLLEREGIEAFVLLEGGAAEMRTVEASLSATV
jgi:hydroxyacylglutathione hydrolase